MRISVVLKISIILYNKSYNLLNVFLKIFFNKSLWGSRLSNENKNKINFVKH